jgi:hypothetical protein
MRFAYIFLIVLIGFFGNFKLCTEVYIVGLASVCRSSYIFVMDVI